AKTQRDRATHAAGKAASLTDFSLVVDEKVRPLPGGVAVRDELVKQLAAALPDLEAWARSEPAFAGLALTFLEKQADIAAEQQQNHTAITMYQKLIDQLTLDVSHNPTQAIPLTRLASANRKLAGLLDQPQPMYQAAIGFAERAFGL